MSRLWFVTEEESHIEAIIPSHAYFHHGRRDGAPVTNFVPEFELVGYLDTHFRLFFRSMDGSLTPIREALYNRRKRSFVSDTISVLSRNGLMDAIARYVLSFCDVSLDPSYVSTVSSYARKVVEETKDENELQVTKVKVEVTLCCTFDIVYDEGTAMRLLEEEEEMNRKHVKVAVETKLKEEEWEENMGGGSGACTICLEDFGAGEKVGRMPCAHYFHKECISKWLVEECNSCPLCRYVIT